MATEEDPKPAHVPPYPEMILAAIDALDDKNGSNKTAISGYIEEKYDDLPPAHTSLLAAHLARMKESGELVFAKNNYFRKDAVSVPPKRGRGRPPKPKDPNATPTPARDPNTPRRGRGRPPKPKDAMAEAVEKASSGMPRPRGRPPGRPSKKAKVAKPVPTRKPAPAPAASGDTPVKRGRGRPPKVKPAAEETAA